MGKNFPKVMNCWWKLSKSLEFQSWLMGFWSMEFQSVEFRSSKNEETSSNHTLITRWSSPVWLIVVEWTKEGCLSSESDTRYVHDVPNECVAPNLSISRCDQLCWSIVRIVAELYIYVYLLWLCLRT